MSCPQSNPWKQTTMHEKKLEEVKTTITQKIHIEKFCSRKYFSITNSAEKFIDTCNKH